MAGWGLPREESLIDRVSRLLRFIFFRESTTTTFLQFIDPYCTGQVYFSMLLLRRFILEISFVCGHGSSLLWATSIAARNPW